jgi:NAD-dependent deacetylase
MDFSGELIGLLRSANSMAVLTGSGISAESGVPTFRDAQTGLWEKYDPLQLATPEAFLENPELVWSWYKWRRQLIKNATPNPGHFSLVDFESKFDNFTLITQNVDGLHQRAGSKNVIELHGNINRSRCWRDGHHFDVQPDNGPAPPLCPNCGLLLRPDVVWFGENLPVEELETASVAVRSSDIFFSIGTSAVVYPAASLIPEASRWGAAIVEINLELTPISTLADFLLQGKSSQILPNLYKEAFY